MNLERHHVHHLLGRRVFVFADEWLTYAMLLYLYFQEEYLLIAGIAPFAIAFNAYGYWGLWRLRKRYGLQDRELILPLYKDN